MDGLVSRARDRDGTTLEEVTGGSFNTMITYCEQLQKASQGEESRAPVDFAAVLGAMQLAQNLQLTGKVIMFGNSADYIGDPSTNQNDLVQGYGSVVFSKSTLTESQEASAACPDPVLADETTTTTNAPTTPQGPTLEPAPFGSVDPATVKLTQQAANVTEKVQTVVHFTAKAAKLRHNDTQLRRSVAALQLSAKQQPGLAEAQRAGGTPAPLSGAPVKAAALLRGAAEREAFARKLADEPSLLAQAMPALAF